MQCSAACSPGTRPDAERVIRYARMPSCPLSRSMRSRHRDNLEGRTRLPGGCGVGRALHRVPWAGTSAGSGSGTTRRAAPCSPRTPRSTQRETPELPTNDEGFFEIAEADQLRMLDEFPAERFVLTTDIDLSRLRRSRPLGARRSLFAGELDGAGHALRGLHVRQSAGCSLSTAATSTISPSRTPR